MTPFDLAALRAREYADQCDADNDPVRAQWARAQAAKYELCLDGDWWDRLTFHVSRATARLCRRNG